MKPRLLIVDALSNYGGAHRVMVAVVPLLQRHLDVVVLDAYGNAQYRKALSAEGVMPLDVGMISRRPYVGGKGTWMRPLCVLRNLPKLCMIRWVVSKRLREIRPDVVYTNQLPMARLLATLPQVWWRPFVWHCHGMADAGQIGRSVCALLHRSRTAAIAVSQATARCLRQVVPCEKVHVCYNGICIEDVERKAAAGPTAPLPERLAGQTVFLLAATLGEQKGQLLAVEALARAVKHGSNAALWLAGGVAAGGDCEYASAVKSAAERWGIAECVHHLGWREDIWAVMMAADVSILATQTNESFGLVLAEGMALGKACIGPRLGGVPEVIDDGVTGLLFEPRQTDRLAEAMIRLCADLRFRNSCGVFGRSRVARLFSHRTQVDGILGVLSSVLRMRT